MVKIDGYAAFAQKILQEAQVLSIVATNALTHVNGGTVAAGRRGVVYGMVISNQNATACTVAICENATRRLGPFYLLGFDQINIPLSPNPAAPVGVFAEGNDIRARVSTVGTNVTINLYYYAQPTNS